MTTPGRDHTAGRTHRPLGHQGERDTFRDPWWRSRHNHRDLPRDVADSLARARRTRGWTLREAGNRLGIAHSMIAHLEHAERRPSVALAELLVRGYRLSGREADRLFEVARPWAGRSSPYRTGLFPVDD